MTRTLFAFGLFSLLAPVAHAARILKLPPISLVTVHGGYLQTTSPTTEDHVCSTVGLVQIPMNKSGVRCVYHHINFHIKNISSLAQNVSVSLDTGTYVLSKNSGGTATTNPSVSNPNNITFSSNRAGGTFSLAANASAEYRVILSCDSASCFISDNFAGTLQASGSTFVCDSTNTTSVPQVCIDLRTNVVPVFTIAEDRGAIIASVQTVAHRAGGSVDHHLTSPPSFQLNGGRPF